MAAPFVGLNSTFDQQRQVINDLSATVDNILTGVGTISTLDTTTGTIDYLEGTNVSYSGIGTIHIAMIDQLSVSGVVTSSNGFTSDNNAINPVQITVSGNTLTFSVVGVGSTSFTLS